MQLKKQTPMTRHTFRNSKSGSEEATKEALCLRMLLLHLGFGDPEPTAIYCDNKGAITMGLHPTNKAAMRHVDMREHFCQQHVEAGNVTTPFCSTYDMVADSSSKATPKPTHTRHTSCMFGDQSIAPPPSMNSWLHRGRRRTRP